MKLTRILSLSFLAAALSFAACGGPDESAFDESAAALGASRGPSTGFECDRSTNTCSCTGPIDSQDCLDMADNCSDEIRCGIWVENCICPMWPARTTPKVTAAPVPVSPIGGVRR